MRKQVAVVGKFHRLARNPVSLACRNDPPNRGGAGQMAQPLGAQPASLKSPVLPEVCLAKTHPADMSFSTSLQLHSGQAGDGSSDFRDKCSKQWQQPRHWYSYMGISVTSPCLTASGICNGGLKVKRSGFSNGYRLISNRLFRVQGPDRRFVEVFIQQRYPSN